MKLLTMIAVGLGATCVLAQDTLLTAEEFNSLIVNKTFRAKAVNGKTYDVQLREGGSAVVSVDYNDVGRWRPNGPSGYCTSWNKQTMTENCYVIARREGKLAVLSADGKVGSWIDGIR
ncbi:MAG TPA: hypothetical protein VLJ19_07565 [Variovorax sp.]|nr:hypothetical protein [Variovorax sp.]